MKILTRYTSWIKWIIVSLLAFVMLLSISSRTYSYSGKIAPDLIPMLDTEQAVTVIVYLMHQPQHTLALQTQHHYQEQFDVFLQQLPSVEHFTWPQNHPLSYAEEISRLKTLPPVSLSNTQHITVAQSLKTLRQLQIQEMAQLTQAQISLQQENVVSLIQQLG